MPVTRNREAEKGKSQEAEYWNRKGRMETGETEEGAKGTKGTGEHR